MRAALLVVALVASGCFAEAPSPTGNECAVGSKGCPCTGGGACDAPLECHSQSQNCYDPECDEGSLNCPCFEGMCFGDLMCAEGLCQSPMQSSGSGGTSESTATSQGSASSASVGDTSLEETSVVDSGTTTPAVDEPGCVQCFAQNVFSTCMRENTLCVGTGCMAMRMCIVDQESSFAECCNGISDGHEPWAMIAACLSEGVCLDACAGVMTSCGG